MRVRETEYPRAEEAGKRVFFRLLQYDREGRYDDRFLELLIAYREQYPQSEKFDIFFAKYAMAHNNFEVALEALRVAERIRPLNMVLWRCLVRCYKEMGRKRRFFIWRF